MPERTTTVASSAGLHARDGAPIDDAMDASSILSLMKLGAEHGSVVVLRAEGDGADAALDSLVQMLETDLDAL